MKRLATALAALAVVVALSFFALPFLAEILIVRAEPLVADAMIVLSGSAVQVERISWAVSLMKQGQARQVIVTNDGVRSPWSRERQSRPMMVERTRQELISGGVLESQVVQLPGRVRSTYDEAVALKAYIGEHPLRTVLIVTSAYHSRRALWVFRHVLRDTRTIVGIDPVPAGNQSPAPDTWWVTRRGWRQVGAEYPKFAYYLVRYR